jgi:MFS transporter, PAT family, beta-lactamase induction signal transducer AmpG
MSGYNRLPSIRQKNIVKTIISRRMLVSLIMGFSCGLPLLLTLGVLQAWMKDANIDLTIIGMVNLVQIPYTWKFIWAPIVDRFHLPFLGRRRGWLLISQLCLMLSIMALGFSNPLDNLVLMMIMAMLVAFFSATQDIVVDAYRREDLPDHELGLGSSLYMSGYRLGNMLASGGGLIMADYMSWSAVYMIMAICMSIGIVTTLFTPEPKEVDGSPVTLKAAVIEPFVEYFKRSGAIWMLAFILLYKVGDMMASAITIPFYMDIGFTKTEIGAVVKVFGTWAIIAGAIIGGTTIVKLGINRSLWVFGFLQAISTAGFALLARIGHSVLALSGVIAFENFSMGMGTAAFLAFMASITDKRFTATQYALLSSLMAVPRVIISAPTGYLAKIMGWESFFILCTLIAIPGMLLLFKFAPWNEKTNK